MRPTMSEFAYVFILLLTLLIDIDKAPNAISLGVPFGITFGDFCHCGHKNEASNKIMILIKRVLHKS